MCKQNRAPISSDLEAECHSGTRQLRDDDLIKLGIQAGERLRQELDAERDIIKRESAIQSALARKALERIKGRQADATSPQPIPGTKPAFTAVNIKASVAGHKGQPDVKELASDIARHLAELVVDGGTDVVLSLGRPTDRSEKGPTPKKPASGKSKLTKLSRANQTLLSLAEERRRAFIRDGYPETAADQLLAEQFCSLSAEKLRPLINRRMGPVDAKTIRRTDVYKRWATYRLPKKGHPISTKEIRSCFSQLGAAAEGFSISSSSKSFFRENLDGSEKEADAWARTVGVALPAAF